jgi:rhodanese-related sulfurtransferase
MAQRIAGARAAAAQTLREAGYDEATIAMLMAN